MEEKSFMWTTDLTRKFFRLRFQYESLFKEKKQAWSKFHNVLLEKGFPEEMTINHIRKKWSYTYDCYRLAKRTNNKCWIYYKMFDKHYKNTKVLDKYESWSDEMRLKLITCIKEAKLAQLEFQSFWRTVERAMRCQDLPHDCYVQDLKGLWQHLRTTFSRKHRNLMKKRIEESDWPLYSAMLNYYQKCEASNLIKLETESAVDYSMSHRNRKSRNNENNQGDVKEEIDDDFQWSRDITESFIQIRLQNDWMFREKKWACWEDLLNIMKQEYGFPKTLTYRDISRKWSSTYADYQKAKATNNTSWLYFNLFELYLGEGSLSFNPLVGWQDEWVLKLISARTDFDSLFRIHAKEQCIAWRSVEARLRVLGLPIDHSLLDLPEIWSHLLKTFKWKQKFAEKKVLKENWPYFDAMSNYIEIRIKEDIPKQVDRSLEDNEFDYEDDMKLLDLKQSLNLKPKVEVLVVKCRSCYSDDGCVNICQLDTDGVDLAYKLSVIGGVEVGPSDNLPSQICFNCLQELENAYKFRRKCQETDSQFRSSLSNKVKLEVFADGNEQNENTTDNDASHFDDDVSNFDDFVIDLKKKQKKEVAVKKERKPIIRRRKKRPPKTDKDYAKMCDVCGKHTRNLANHLDMHATGKAYACDICDKKFKFKSGLVIHKAIHDPTPKKTCEVCGKTFYIMAQYRKHFVYHANERKHECETCGKRFNTIDILKVHVRSHTDERPFSCKECGKTFRTAGCVSRHKRIVHRKVIKTQ